MSAYQTYKALEKTAFLAPLAGAAMRLAVPAIRAAGPAIARAGQAGASYAGRLATAAAPHVQRAVSVGVPAASRAFGGALGRAAGQAASAVRPAAQQEQRRGVLDYVNAAGNVAMIASMLKREPRPQVRAEDPNSFTSGAVRRG